MKKKAVPFPGIIFEAPPCGRSIHSASPGNLTFTDIHPPLGHEAHPPLGLFAAEGVEVVDVGRLLCDLKVPDAAVPLHTHTHTLIEYICS